jgi:hypothetical protein
MIISNSSKVMLRLWRLSLPDPVGHVGHERLHKLVGSINKEYG